MVPKAIQSKLWLLPFIYLVLACGKSDIKAPDQLIIDMSPEKIERGAYLAKHVAACFACHSPRDFSKFSGPTIKDSLGAGGNAFTKLDGIPGVLWPRNITPYAIGIWSDAELLQTVTTGLRGDKHPLFELMPYKAYGKSDRRDILAMLAYVRSIQPVEKKQPESNLDFPVNLFLKKMPQEAAFVDRPPESDTLAYGKYLVQMAACIDCHSMRTKTGKFVKGMQFAGGMKFPLPGEAWAVSANITPDSSTGIGAWSQEHFVLRFKQAREDAANEVAPGEFNTHMPWKSYGGMKESDLGAIYQYLHSLNPVKHQVNHFIPAKKS